MSFYDETTEIKLNNQYDLSKCFIYLIIQIANDKAILDNYRFHERIIPQL